MQFQINLKGHLNESGEKLHSKTTWGISEVLKQRDNYEGFKTEERIKLTSNFSSATMDAKR